jgi:hypothetical protein
MCLLAGLLAEIERSLISGRSRAVMRAGSEGVKFDAKFKLNAQNRHRPGC